MLTSSETTKYISLFHTRDHAAAALKDLDRANVPASDIAIVGHRPGHDEGMGLRYHGSDELAALGVPQENLKHMQDSLKDGGVVLIVDGAVDPQGRIEGILHNHSANKINDVQNEEIPMATPYDDTLATTTTALPLATTERMDEAASGVIPVIQEDLVVGKREVGLGGVRVTSHLVEEPVSTSVTLREEHAVIERRPVDRAVTDADFRTGQVITLTESAEEAVVGKVARVVEEVYAGTAVTEHTEAINETVRHTEVNVEPTTDVTTTTRKTY